MTPESHIPGPPASGLLAADGAPGVAVLRTGDGDRLEAASDAGSARGPLLRRGVVRRRLSAFYAASFASGAAGLTHEILWIDRLALGFGHTAGALAAVLAAFMAGLGIGSLSIGRLGDRTRSRLRLYVLLELLLVPAAFLAFAAAPHLGRLDAFCGAAVSAGARDLLRFSAAFVLLLPASVLMGGTLPVLARLATRAACEIGVRPGRIYAWNTAGALAGTLAAGFVLLPLWGQ